MTNRILLIFVLTVSGQFSQAQDVDYAKHVIQKLCSPEMKGRGYVSGGDKIAADFLAAEFTKFQLKKYSKTYFQKYTTPVNSFPGKLSLKINGIELTPGKDFLVEPGSPKIEGKYSTVTFSASDLLDETVWVSRLRSAAGKFVVVETYDKSKFTTEQQKKVAEVISYLLFGDHAASGVIILTKDKLTWSGATALSPRPSFTVLVSDNSPSVYNVEVLVENKFFKSYETQNVVGFIEGERSDSLLVFTAHYDHLGMMGDKNYFPGANDNASGVAFLLNLAKHFFENKPEFTTVFIAFSGEEIGLIGSQYFTENPLFPLSKIKFLINFDLAGTGDDGIQIVNGKMYQSKFDLISSINQEQKLLPQIKIRGEACNSDHCMFNSKGVPCFFIYTLGGIQAYHDINDKAETLPLTEFEDYFKLVTAFISKL